MKNIILPLVLLLIGCSNEKQQQNISINDLADIYVERILSTYPESSYYVDMPIEDHSGLYIPDSSNMAKWEVFEDSLYSEIQKVDDPDVLSKVDRITYWLLKEELESSIQFRICKRQLWNINHMWGFYHGAANIADFQPVGDETSREQAFIRWNKFPELVNTEMQNLEKGLNKGYSMPKEIVELVIDQVEILANYELKDSPFMSPANRDSSVVFKEKWELLVLNNINPSLLKYANYLRTDYLDKARTEVSVLSLPNGDACYKAFVRKRTTTDRSGQEIYDLGVEIVNANISTIEELGMELYKSDNFVEIISTIKADSSLYFKTADEILAYNQAIMDTAKLKCENWFDILPSVEATIKPYLPHESGVGSYESATENTPPYFRLSLKNPNQQTYQGNEKLSFHEAYPGHHLQIGIEKDIRGLHPIRKFIGFGSYVEGWARYSEQLAEEMGLYNHKASLISRRSWPSRGMVVDPALHIKSWSKDSVINFMMQSGQKKTNAENLYYRMIVSPAQLTSYDVGGEEIKALRKLAEKKLGDAFSIKEFHTKVLENGSIPLSALRQTIEEWIEYKPSTGRSRW